MFKHFIFIGKVFYFFVLIGQAVAYSIQMLSFLPQSVKDGIRHLNKVKLYEIRLRANKPVSVNYDGRYQFLSIFGLTDKVEHAVICDSNDINDCIFKAGKYSVYSIEEQINKGFITTENGVRIGLAGEYVFEKGQPLTLKNYTSLCIRVPHAVIDCSMEIFNRCLRDKLKSILIVSPPGIGKTTILRDLGRILSLHYLKNILVCDERGEIGDMGYTCDVLRFCDKETAFEAGIRAMRPDIIITDELSANDCNAVKKAISAGIYVLASAHFNDFSKIKPPFFGLFNYYVVLDENTIGKITKIYDDVGREIP